MPRLKLNKYRLLVMSFIMILLFGVSLLGHASVSSNSGSQPPHFIFYFANNRSLLMRDYYTNQTALEKLDEMLNEPDYITKVDSIL